MKTISEIEDYLQDVAQHGGVISANDTAIWQLLGHTKIQSNFLKTIDLELLKKQRNYLLTLSKHDHIEGTINLLDHIIDLILDEQDSGAIAGEIHNNPDTKEG